MKTAVRKFKETLDIRSSVFNRLRSHRYFSVGLLTAVVLLAACFHVWQRVRVMELVKETSHLRNSSRLLVDDYKKVYSEIVSLSLASRIETYARDTLGMVPMTADRLYTLVRGETRQAETDEWTAMLSAVERVARYMPVITESSARAGELSPVKFDSVALTGGGR